MIVPKHNEAITVADVMTPDPVALRPNDTIGQAEDIMDEQGFRQIPIVSGKELVGILTDRDIRSFVSGQLFGAPKERDRAMNTKIATVMTTKPISIEPDDDLADAVELLIEGKMGGIPVVDEERGLVGIVTYVDVLKKYLETL
jgi:acetoin utilization protein AcuB